ncbi:MAG TPA: CapA family protein [Acidimicrobiales bacterium]
MSRRVRLLSAGVGLALLATAGSVPDETPLRAPGEAAGDAWLVAGPDGDREQPPPPPSRSFTLVATGDVLLHSPLWRQAEADAAAAGRRGRDFRPLLAAVRPTVASADVAVCHLETPVAPSGGPFSGYPAFSVPPEIVPALAATGYDACTTASNHVYDQGAAGIDRTLAALDAAGLQHAGSARSPAEATRTTMLRAGPARVALLSYTFGFNGYPAPNGEAWRSNPIDPRRIERDALRARRRGADVVVVAVHWGDEYRHEPNAQQTELAPRLLASPDIDLLLGHHAHVVQPLERIRGEWVVYGMGNLVARHATPGAANAEGVAVRFTFTERRGRWRVTRAEYQPLLMAHDRRPIRLVDVQAALADPATDPAVRRRLALARSRTAAVVASRGATRAGLVPLGAGR